MTSSSKKTTWQSYEEVANFVVEQCRQKFGLDTVEGKQDVDGQLTGTTWEIDGKGVIDDGNKFLIIEARRYTTSRLDQEKLGGIAYRIQDTGASGAIVVSPLELQSGAELVAKANNVHHIELDAESTKENWAAKIGNVLNLGFTDTVSIKNIQEEFTIQILDKDGNIISSETQKS